MVNSRASFPFIVNKLECALERADLEITFTALSVIDLGVRLHPLFFSSRGVLIFLLAGRGGEGEETGCSVADLRLGCGDGVSIGAVLLRCYCAAPSGCCWSSPMSS